jgi:hypothetical protein
MLVLLVKTTSLMDDDLEDTLCWSRNPKGGFFTAKLGYKAWTRRNVCREKNGGGFRLWKTKAPTRCKITLWLALNNKLLTWDNCAKRGWCGPNRCILCKENSESISHLFISCPYATQVMKLIKEKLDAILIGTRRAWMKASKSGQWIDQ